MTKAEPDIGPLLFSEGYDSARARHRLAVVLGSAEPPPDVTVQGSAVVPTRTDRIDGYEFWRFAFALPEGGGEYTVAGRLYPVHLGAPGADLRVGFVSCNGKEHGDFDRPEAVRQAMWVRLAETHRNTPLSLLIHGGDQIYADGALYAHPDLECWQDLPPRHRHEIVPTPEVEAAVTRFFFDRWRRNVTALGTAQLLAEVPSVAMWDDHDIFDGYGSHPEGVEDSPTGEMLFRVARRFFRLFQAGGRQPALSGTETFGLRQPGFSVLLPDLRSERGRRRVMGPDGWAETKRHVAALPPHEPLLVVSTVPALGPRLSLLEGLHRVVPGMQKYEDDLRDQWQSRAHRAEWRRFLSIFAERAETGAPVTFVSGEIHLAARGEMTTPSGTVLHQ
ncbi:MAG: alkaline phosphatase D family protein, partial [Pseudomonadota bacterium]